jgi:hypothetical protein
MSATVLAPYLPLTEIVQVGPWTLLPFATLSETEALPDAIHRSVMRLADAYKLPSGGGRPPFTPQALALAPGSNARPWDPSDARC